MTLQSHQRAAVAEPDYTDSPRLPRRSRSAADWDAIEREYRAGIKSIRQIAKEQGISHTAIQKRAEVENWPRNLAKKIRAAADAKLAREVATDQVSTEVAKATEREIVDVNAAIQVALIRSHRVDIQRARSLAQRLMADLEEATKHRLLLEEVVNDVTAEDRSTQRRTALMKAVSIAEHVSTLEVLSRVLKNLITLERQAFGIEQMAEQNPDDSYEARLRRLYEAGKSAIGIQQ